MPNLILNGQTAEKSINLLPLITLTSEDLKTSLLNILMSLPFGFGLPFLINIQMKKIIIISLLFSMSIEFLQLITGFLAKITFRIADINDIIFNTIGAIFGYLLFIKFIHIFHKIYTKKDLSSNQFLKFIHQLSNKH